MTATELIQTNHDRTRAGCLCCGNRQLERRATIVSGFLAERAWKGTPELTGIAFCNECGFRFFQRGLSTEETLNLYRGYRNENYLGARNRWEPFYTRTQHQAVLAWSRSPGRAVGLRKSFDEAGLPDRFRYVLDHGGSGGHMLREIHAERKVVFDPSGCETIGGVEAVSVPTRIPPRCDLFLSCQVLEHVSDPKSYLSEAGVLCAEGAFVYIEVPDELWRDFAFPGNIQVAWLRLLLRQRHLLILSDMLSTGCRVKLGFLPPMGFVPMREHLNYFTIKALDSILLATGFQILLSGRNAEGQIFAIARKGAGTSR